MENNTASIPNILAKTELLSNTAVDLYKLKIIKVGSRYFADVASKIIISSLIFLLIIFASIGAGFYINNLFGNNYMGFLAVAAFYLLLTIIFALFRNALIHRPIQNSVIRKTLKDL
jgi:hypothetical protein